MNTSRVKVQIAASPQSPITPKKPATLSNVKIAIILGTLTFVCGGVGTYLTLADRSKSVAATPASGSSAQLATPVLSSSEYRARAMQAFQSGNLIAPANDNALEWYVAAYDADPDDRASHEAMYELLPGAYDALGKALSNNDQTEIVRLLAILRRADAQSAQLQGAELKWQAIQQAINTPIAADANIANTSQPLSQTATLPEPITTESAIPPAQPELIAAQSAPKETLATITKPADTSVRTSLADQPPVTESATDAAMTPATNLTSKVAPRIQEARVLSQTRPTFPPEARRRRASGWVDLQVEVDAQGRVSKATVIAAEPNRLFDAHAKREIMRWRFQPKMIDDQAVSSTIRQRINFDANG